MEINKKLKSIIIVFSPVFIMLLSINAKSQNDKIITGYFTKSDLLQENYKTWFNENYDYNYDKSTVKEIKRNIKNVKIVIIMGTWCSDSKLQVPEFLKILDDINFNYKNLKLIGVDREKLAGEVDISVYEIEKVPTFIFYKNNKEIGRIIESPTQTLEKDFLIILLNSK